MESTRDPHMEGKKAQLSPFEQGRMWGKTSPRCLAGSDRKTRRATLYSSQIKRQHFLPPDTEELSPVSSSAAGNVAGKIPPSLTQRGACSPPPPLFLLKLCFGAHKTAALAEIVPGGLHRW